MAGNQAGKKAKRVKNKRKNEAMSGLLSDREYRRHERDLKDEREMAAREKTEAPYTYDFGKWMANQQGTHGALERIMGRTIH